MKNVRLVATSLMLLAAGLAGCGGGDDDGGTSDAIQLPVDAASTDAGKQCLANSSYPGGTIPMTGTDEALYDSMEKVVFAFVVTANNPPDLLQIAIGGATAGAAPTDGTYDLSNAQTPAAASFFADINFNAMPPEERQFFLADRGTLTLTGFEPTVGDTFTLRAENLHLIEGTVSGNQFTPTPNGCEITFGTLNFNLVVDVADDDAGVFAPADRFRPAARRFDDLPVLQ